MAYKTLNLITMYTNKELGMYLSCASVCYRGYAEDEVSAMLEHIPKTGFKYVDIHGPMTWSPQAIDVLDTKELKKRLEALKLNAPAYNTPGFGGTNEEQIEMHAKAIAKAVILCSELGGFSCRIYRSSSS